MLTIQSAMLVILGVLVASLLVLLVMPLYRARTVRLTERRLKQAMPLTESEIAADKDRLRADYAIKVHKLEAKVEQAELSAARQQIELNRRDAAISALEGQIGTLSSSLEEHENARRVLEQTITDRFPRVEVRLNEAKKLLFQRDREIQSLSETAARQAKALEEATLVNTQQRDELLRLNNVLVARSSRGREGVLDPKFEAEVALREELEVLSAKTREQAALIARLQAAGGAMAHGSSNGAAAAAPASQGDGMIRAGAELEELRKKLAEAEIAARKLKSEAATHEAGRTELEAQLRALRAERDDQGAEIAKLAAALKTFEGGEERSSSLKDSRLAIKARMQALQAENEAQAATIHKMRVEIAAANERLAKQAAHFMDEMRRLGSGGALPAAGAARKPRSEPAPARRSLAERITEPKAPARAAAAETRDPSRVSGFLRALGGGSSGAGSEAQPAMADPERDLVEGAAATPVRTAASAAPAQPRKGRLLERITSVSKG